MAEVIYLAEVQDFPIPARSTDELENELENELSEESTVNTGTSSEIRPKSAKEIGQIYNVTDKTVQGWVSVVCRAYFWLPVKNLKIGKSNRTRYTALCQELIAQYRQSELTADDWVEKVWEAHPEEAAQVQQQEESKADSPSPQMPQSQGLADLLQQTSTPGHLASNGHSPLNQSDPQGHLGNGEILDAEIVGVGVEQLEEQLNATRAALKLMNAQTEGLITQNQIRFEQLTNVLNLHAHNLHQMRVQQKQSWEAEAATEAIDEFIVKTQKKNEILTQLEALKQQAGKLSVPQEEATTG